MVSIVAYWRFVQIIATITPVVGDWPSGKALGSGPRIGGSNPSSPAKMVTKGDRNASLNL